MKKLAKLSLVAAVAVAGMTTASATSLEEAIKGVDVNGMVRYRYTQIKEKGEDHEQNNKYDVEVNTKVPVNDMVSANIKLDVNSGELDSRENASVSNGKVNVQVEKAYFTFAKDGFTVTAGKQALPGPLTDGLNGTGIVAVTPAFGPVTLAAAYMNGHDDVNILRDGDTKDSFKWENGKFKKSTKVVDLKGGAGKDIYAVAALGNFDFVTANAWFAKVQEYAKAYSLDASATVGPATVGVAYAEKKLKNKIKNALNLKDGEAKVLKLNAAATFGMFDVEAGFAKTGKENGVLFGASLDGEEDAAVNDFQAEQIAVASEWGDAKAFKLGASVKPVDAVKVGLEFLKVKGYEGHIGVANETKQKGTEVVGRVAYSMSKNFVVSSFFSKAKIKEGNETDKSNMGRLELKYTF